MIVSADRQSLFSAGNALAGFSERFTAKGPDGRHFEAASIRMLQIRISLAYPGQMLIVALESGQLAQ